MFMSDYFKKIDFLGSFPEIAKCPQHGFPEYAFIGRSNVGKSSLINFLANQANLAKTSKKPGKTQLINLFMVDDLWCMADLPGYGYAQVSKKQRHQWKKMIYNYLERRQNLVLTFVLLDARLPLQQNDLEFIQWLGEKGVAFTLVFTKIDGVPKTKLNGNITRIEKELLKSWDSLPTTFRTSAVLKAGREEILDYIAEINDSL
jgi:GTP-binding protein